MDKWTGKIALVTGATSGIGRDVSLRLIEYGMKVIGCGRNVENLINIKTKIPNNSKGEFFPFECDIMKEADILKMFNYIETNFKSLHVLINNAGLCLEGSILQGKTENWNTMFQTNVMGLSICAREAFKLLKENETTDEIPGHIINISSIGGHMVIPEKQAHFYSASKFAVTAITEGIRQELKEIHSKIRVTQISPGLVATEFVKRAFGEEIEKRMTPVLDRALKPCDISAAIVYVLSAESRNNVQDIILRPTI